MKPFVYFFSLVFLIACGQSKQDQHKDFESLGDDSTFREKHDEPRQEEEVNLKGEMMNLSLEDGTAASAYVVGEMENDQYLLVFQEWWGLNNYIKEEADRLSEQLGDVSIIAPDLYEGRVASTREEAKEYMQSAKEERLNEIIDVVLKKTTAGSEIATIGWCFGGGWSLKAALTAGNRAVACVMYYGMPVQDVSQLKKLSTDVLFIYGEKDEWINKEVAEKFEKNMHEAGKEVIIKSFDADHAFANPTQERYKQQAAEEANQLVLEYLQRKLN
jgi:carboxymethylenebutenolidase